MSINQLLNQFLGADATDSGGQKPVSSAIGNLSSSLPGGLMGGIAAGGVVSLLLGNKSARKMATKMAGYGGMAVLGGLAYKAYDNWKHQQNEQTEMSAEADFHQYGIASSAIEQEDFELAMVKVMIAAAKSDGHIDNEEQRKIISTIDAMELNPGTKSLLFDLLLRDIDLQEIPVKLFSTPLKSEIYMAALVVVGELSGAESLFFRQLEAHLEMPADLARQLQLQVRHQLPKAA